MGTDAASRDAPASAPPGTTPDPATSEHTRDDPDWTDQVSDLVVDGVDKVRVRTTGPVLNVAHASVYGLVAAILALPVLVVLAIGVIRFLDWAVPGDVWIVYLGLAVVLWVAGLVCWARRGPRRTPAG